MRKWVILFFVIKPFISLSQNEEYRGSAWASIVVRHKVSDNYNLVFDIGYRTFDDYFKRRKQDLIRGLIEGKISGKHSIGIGVAYFENISSNLSTFKKEFRPFLHYQFVNKSDKSFFRLVVPKITNENTPIEISAELYNKSYELTTLPEINFKLIDKEKKIFSYNLISMHFVCMKQN